MKHFDEFTARFGARLSESTFATISGITTFRKISKNEIERCTRQGRPMKLEAAYIKNAAFNAFAANHKGTDIIAINSAIPESLRTIMFALMRDKEVAPEIGDAAGEEPVLFDRDKGSRGEKAPLSPPKDHNRLMLAFDLAGIAELIIIQHEFAHLRNGHVDWLANRFGLQLIDEINMAGASGLSGLDLQTLEWDADCGAVQQVLALTTSATNMTRSDGRIVAIPSEENYFGSIDMALRRLSFATYVCYRLFSDRPVASSIEEVLESSHPPARIRMSYNATFMLTLLEYAGLERQSYRHSVGAGVQEAELAWSRAFQEEPLNVFSPEIIGIGSELMAMMEKRWRTLRGELEPFTRSGILAPVDPNDLT